MLFRNAIRLLIENFKGVYKIMLYKFIVMLVSSALCCAMILPELIEIANSAPAEGLVAGVKDFFSSFFSADGEALTLAKEETLASLRDLVRLIASKATTITLAIVGCLLVYLLKRFAETLCYFSVGSTLNDKMSTYSETPFFTAFVANLGKAGLYALLYVPFVFVFDLLTAGLSILILSQVSLFPALFFTMTVIVLMQALKLTTTGLWMPAMTADGKRFKELFRLGNKSERKQRLKAFATYVVAVYLVIIVNVVAALCTFASALLITVPASFMLFICLQYVYYYTVTGKKYYITYERIASNPDFGDREHFFDYIDETAPQNTTETAEEIKQNTQR